MQGYPHIVISLTSFPQRMGGLHLTVASLLRQTVPADLVVIWLANEQFPNGMDDVPQEVRSLLSERCIIRWCEDYRSYKKLIPSLSSYPESIIITADDDVIYEKRLVEKLLRGMEAHPGCIIASLVTKMHCINGVFFNERGGHASWDGPCFLNKLVGCGGCLYPPHCLDEEVMNVSAFKELAPTSDDVWFWLMAVRAGTRVHRIPDGEWLPRQNPLSRGLQSLTSVNDGDYGQFSTHVDNVLNAYPDIREVLLGEAQVVEAHKSKGPNTASKVYHATYALRRLPLARQLYVVYLKKKNARLALSRYYKRRIMQLELRVATLEEAHDDAS